MAETGRSCWGSGQQDASGSEADAGSRNPGSGTASAVTERLSSAAAYGQALLRTTSQSASQTAPLVGEPLAKPFTLRGLPRPLPLGEVSPKVTERASPARKSRGHSDRQAFCQSDTIAVPVILGQQPCPLSRACARQLPQRGSHWHVGQALLRTTSQSRFARQLP